MKATMSKKLLALILALAIALALALALGADAAASAATLVAVPTSANVLVDGKNVDFDAYNIAGNNYFKLRDIAYTLNGSVKQFAVAWDGSKNAISLTSGRRYSIVGGEMTGKGAGNKTPNPTSSTIYLDNREINLTAYNIGGNNYFKLRDIGKSLNFGVDWDDANRTIAIATNSRYRDESGKTSYSASYFGAAQGSAKTLEGRSVLVSIYLSRENPGWDAAGISKSAEHLRIAMDFLISESVEYGKDLEFIYDIETYPDLRYDMSYDGEFAFFTGDSDSEMEPALAEKTNGAIDDFIENSIPYKALADKYGTDSIAYIVFVDKGEGRCYALPNSVGGVSNRYHEKAFMITSDSAPTPATIAHETLHLFSAPDLYKTSVWYGVEATLVNYVKQNYPNEIMYATTSKDSSGVVQYDRVVRKITHLTAYSVGWIPDIAELTQFPNIARDIPCAIISRREYLNGIATWDYSPSGTYSGNFVNGIRTGHGVFEYASGERYDGNWENDTLNGQGVLKCSDGRVYTGNFVNGYISNGTLECSDGTFYTGSFANGYIDGQGTIKYTSGHVYTGSFEKGYCSGYGEMKYPSGHVYVGNWEKNQCSGYGEMTYPSGKVQAGLWKEDKYIGSKDPSFSGESFDSISNVVSNISSGNLSTSESGMYVD